MDIISSVMFIVFGILAIISAVLNVVWKLRKKESTWFCFASLSLTALTLCAFYQTDAAYVIKEDWSALMDITPAISKALWFLTIASILINGISLVKNTDR